MAAAPNSAAQLPGDPKTLSSEEEKERRDLVIAVSTAVTVAVTEKWIADRASNTLASLGYSKDFMLDALKKFYMGLATTSFLLMLEMAKIELNTSEPDFPDDNVIKSITSLESLYEIQYASKGTQRIIDNMRFAVENEITRAISEGKDPDKLDANARRRLRDAIHQFVSREGDYSKMRLGAMKQRTERLIEERGVKATSPEGAFWILDITKKNHTADCLAMANKTWTWEVLAIIRPSNRHYGCGCRLIPMDVARAAGFPGVDTVHHTVPPGTREATRRGA